MSSKPAPSIVGRGAPDLVLAPDELRTILAQAFLTIAPGARVLAIIPDKTRDDNTDLLFPLAAELLAARGVAQFDALVAQGTHVPMTEAEKLTNIGALPAERVRELTGGLLDRSVRLTINRRLGPGVYDTVLIFGATVPHEVAG